MEQAGILCYAPPQKERKEAAVVSIYPTLRKSLIRGELIFIQRVPGHIDDIGPAWDWQEPPAQTQSRGRLYSW
jgi:hypothetical protein